MIAAMVYGAFHLAVWKPSSYWHLPGSHFRKAVTQEWEAEEGSALINSLSRLNTRQPLLLWRNERNQERAKRGLKMVQQNSKGDHLTGPCDHICGPDVPCNQSTCPHQKASIICSTRSVANVKVWRNPSTWQTKFVICVTSKLGPQWITALWGHLIMIKWTKNQCKWHFILQWIKVWDVAEVNKIYGPNSCNLTVISWHFYYEASDASSWNN